MKDYYNLIVKEMKRRYFYNADTRVVCLELANIATGEAELHNRKPEEIARATVEAWREWDKGTDLTTDFVTYACICASTGELLRK